MDIVSNTLDFLRAGWDATWEVLDGFTNASLLVACLVTIAICLLIFDRVNVITGFIVLAFLGGAVYFGLLAVDAVRSWSGGASLALVVAVIAILVRLGVIWRKTERSGKLFTAIVAVALVLAIIPIVGAVNPNLPVAGQFSAALSRTGQFIEELSQNAEQGARTVR